MYTLPLRELQQRGAKALPQTHDPVVLTGRRGPLYLLVPVDPEHLADQERAVRRALAKTSLRAWQQRAMESGLDMLSDDEIEAEITAARNDSKRGQRRTTRTT
ncbi:MAG: prevent-host-death protein [Planctomycetota bacterium]|nr:MAG: prevent-host-death protein [Planctomycetota bacterium]